MTPSRPHQINIDDYALVVGINHYPRFEDLHGAIKDAEEVLGWLRDEPEGGGLPDANCIAVYSTGKSERPIQDEIDDAIAQLFELAGNNKPARRLYVYFSGHGMAPSKLVTGMCVANWSSLFRDRALNSQEYLDALLTSGRFREVIMLLDCCRVRLVATKGKGPGNPIIVPGPGAPNSKSFQANATEFLNKAYEGPVPGATTDAGLRGYFTRALLEGLRGGAATKPCGVPASELKKFLERRTPELALADGIDQQPEITNGLPSRDEPIFGTAKPIPPPPSPPSGGPTRIASEETLGASPNVPLELFTSLRDADVSVLDQHSKSVFRGKIAVSHRLMLPRGVYTVFGQHQHHSAEVAVALEEPSRVHVFDPRLYTAATVAGRPSSHEYYTDPSREWSRRATRPPIRPLVPRNAISSIFIFVRTASRENTPRAMNLVHHLTLLNQNHHEISQFRSAETRRSKRDGWVAFSAFAPRGFYYLRFSTPPQRETPLQLFAGYQTQVFLMYRDGLMFETMKVFLQKGVGFEPRNDEIAAADTALNGIQNHSDLLSKTALDLLLDGKFHNPMLGLVGAHLLLQEEEINDRISVVLRNLSRLLPQSPDVAALETLARARGVKLLHRPRPPRFDHPPMLRAGLEAVFAESASRPSIIAKRSALPQIAVTLYADTPWSTWQPHPGKPLADRRDVQAAFVQRPLTWVHLALLDEAKKSMDSKVRIELKPEPLARQLGVPPQTVTAAIRDLENLRSDFPIKEVPIEFRQLSFFSQLKSRAKKQSPRTRSRRR